jgi:D-alanine-D-alanine ligase
MRRRRVLLLVHADLVPPDSIEGLSEKQIQPWRTEWDVMNALRRLGHDVQVLGVSDDLVHVRGVVQGFEPHAVFNQLIEFQDVGAYQVHIASYLELLKVPYTGCNPRGLMLARDKALAKKLFRFHRIATPDFSVVPRGTGVSKRGTRSFPLIVKSLEEEASLGLSQASVVHDEDQLRERVEFVHRSVGTDAIVEEYVAGRELTIGVFGNRRLQTLPVWEMFFRKLPEGSLPIATARVKWDLDYQKRIGIDTGPAAELPAGVALRIARVAKRVYRALELSGFARVDLRLGEDGRLFVIEANASPDLSSEEDLAQSALAAAIPYDALIQRVLGLGIAYRPPWEPE